MIRNVEMSNSKIVLNDMQKKEGGVHITSEKGHSQNRVEELKAKIAEGKYSIDLKGTAKKMAQELRP